MTADKIALTKSVILQPLRDALLEHEVTETHVIGIFAKIMNDESQPGATRLNACRMFLDMLGLVHESKNIDLSITHKIADAFDELEMKRQQRITKKEMKVLKEREDGVLEVEE